MMDLPSGFERRVQQFQDGFLKSVDEFHTLLTGNRIFQKRTQGVGVITRGRRDRLGTFRSLSARQWRQSGYSSRESLYRL